MRQTPHFAALASVALLAACAAQPAGVASPAAPLPQPAPAAVTDTSQVNAVVESVNMTERSILLSGGDQRTLASVRVGPQVRNLAQLRPGDRVQIEYAERLAVAIASPGEPAGEVAAVATRAPAGARPGGAVAEAERIRVRFLDYNATSNMVTFTTPAGQTRTIQVQRPEMRRFAAGLRPGDEVDVTFSEALAVRVTPMR